MVKIERFPPGYSEADLNSRMTKMANRQRRRCSYGGIEYESISALAKFLNVSNSTIGKRFKEGEYRGLKLLKL